MRTPAPNQTRPPPASPGTTRRRRSLAPLIAAALTLAAVSTGVAVALSVGQTPARSTGQPAGVAVSPTTVSPTQAATPPSGAAQPSDQGEATPGPAATSPHSPALADGTYDAFVRGVNVDRRTVVIDLAQVIEGEAAIKKALREDGKPEGWASAGYYVRNQNSLLRTLPVARDVRIKFHSSCEDPASGPTALNELSKRIVRFKGMFYYHFTMRDGLVRTMEERQVQPAC